MQPSNFFTQQQWAELVDHGLGHMGLLMNWRTQTNDKYFEFKKNNALKTKKEKTPNLWKKASEEIFKANFPETSFDSPTFVLFKSALSRINQALRKQYEARDRERLSQDLQLIHEEEQLWVGKQREIDVQQHEQELILPDQQSTDPEEYSAMLEEYKNHILYD